MEIEHLSSELFLVCKSVLFLKVNLRSEVTNISSFLAYVILDLAALSLLQTVYV